MFSPWTDLALTGSSHTDVAIHDPVFRPEVFVMLAANYLGDANPKDIRAAPIFGVPDALVLGQGACTTAGCERGNCTFQRR